MQDISTEFEFLWNEEEGCSEEKIFLIDEFKIYLYNYQEQSVQVIIDFLKEFNFSLDRQPSLFVMNSNQTVMFVCADNDIILFDIQDIQNKQMVELDEIFMISEIKACLNKFGKFYILANKLHKTQGVFLIQIDEMNIQSLQSPKFDKSKAFIIKWNNQLDIGNANLDSMVINKGESVIGSL